MSTEANTPNINLEYIEVKPKQTCQYCIIWLHGLGADGNDFVPIVPSLDLEDLGVHFIFPHAPVRPITINGGMPMRGWFDIKGFSEADKQDDKGINDSSAAICNLIEAQELRGLASKHIILAGFSQGAAMALHIGLRYPNALGGIIALSGMLPLADTLAAQASKTNQNTPIFLAHGNQDDILPIQFGINAKNHLLQLGYSVDWHNYTMGHCVNIEEIQELSLWLKQQLSAIK